MYLSLFLSISAWSSSERRSTLPRYGTGPISASDTCLLRKTRHTRRHGHARNTYESRLPVTTGTGSIIEQENTSPETPRANMARPHMIWNARRYHIKMSANCIKLQRKSIVKKSGMKEETACLALVSPPYRTDIRRQSHGSKLYPFRETSTFIFIGSSLFSSTGPFLPFCGRCPCRAVFF